MGARMRCNSSSSNLYIFGCIATVRKKTVHLTAQIRIWVRLFYPNGVSDVEVHRFMWRLGIGGINMVDSNGMKITHIRHVPIRGMRYVVLPIKDRCRWLLKMSGQFFFSPLLLDPAAAFIERVTRRTKTDPYLCSPPCTTTITPRLIHVFNGSHT